MSNISKCENKECPSKEKCYRFTATPNKHRQSYGRFMYEEGKDKCEYFWDNKKQ